MLRDAYVYAPVNWVIIGSGNGSAPVWHQAITWTNADFLPIGPLGTNLIDICIKIQNFLSRKFLGNAFQSVVSNVKLLCQAQYIKKWKGSLYYINHCIQVSVPTSWIRNYIHYKTVLDEITYPFPNFNDATVKVWEDK